MLPARVSSSTRLVSSSTTRAGDADEEICYGTIISRQQYLKDINEWDYKDARLVHETMTEDEIAHWTAGIEIDGAK